MAEIRALSISYATDNAINVLYGINGCTMFIPSRYSDPKALIECPILRDLASKAHRT